MERDPLASSDYESTNMREIAMNILIKRSYLDTSKEKVSKVN